MQLWVSGFVKYPKRSYAHNKQNEERCQPQSKRHPEAAVTFRENALLTRIKALFTIVVKDSYMLVTYILFTLLMFFFEFLVVILKLTWQKTNYERKIEMIEEIGQKRMEFLMRKDSPINDPGYFLPQLEESRKVLNKNISVFGAS